jgi:hypothetical protein
VEPARSKVIPVDFASRRSRLRPASPIVRYADARTALGEVDRFIAFERPPARHRAAEFLGARWEWGWTLFVWTGDDVVGAVWDSLTGARGYVARRWSRVELAAFLVRAREIGGLLVDGDLEASGEVARAEPAQLIGRDAVLAMLAG